MGTQDDMFIFFIIFLLFTIIQFSLLKDLLDERLFKSKKAFILMCIPIIGPIILIGILLIKYAPIVWQEFKESMKQEFQEKTEYIKSLK